MQASLAKRCSCKGGGGGHVKSQCLKQFSLRHNKPTNYQEAETYIYLRYNEVLATLMTVVAFHVELEKTQQSRLIDNPEKRKGDHPSSHDTV